MRILFVNWVDYRDPLRRGGGVSVYQQGVIDALEQQGGHDIRFLATGLAHGFRAGVPRVIPLPGPDRRRYQMVDSGLLAPAHADFGNPAQLDHPATVAAFADFLARSGPYDVVHFNNLEGLPATALACAAAHGARVILSLHNYYPICPQVNLWRNEDAHCADFEGGAACIACLPLRPNRAMIRAAYALEWRCGRLGMGPGTAVFDRLIRPSVALGWRLWKRLRGREPGPAASPSPLRPASQPGVGQPEAAAFAARRAQMVALINAHCHRVLCVSGRVRQIAIDHGIDPLRAVTCRIGSAHAGAWKRTAPRPAFLRPDGGLRLAYLGYMRRDKGFPFLIEALAALPPEQARRLHLTVAARRGEPAMMAAMAALRPRLAGLTHLDGYRPKELDALLAGIDLGVVPVMWEDNLPQVAIEMHARHIPLLCSDRGGAAELGRCAALTFRAGDRVDFARALGGVLSGQITPVDYFRHASPPTTPQAHVAALMAHYAAAPG